MILLPAIDLMDGCVVRLRRGEAGEKTVYSSEPAAWARKWEEAGADWLHIVDLDAAFTGEPRNLRHVEAICAAVNIPCELGGGMRNFQNVSAAFSAGVSRVVLGTRAVEDPGYMSEMCAEFGGSRIAVGVDSRGGRVAIKGWTETTSRTAVEVALAARDAGVQTIIATDISTDGMLAGPNFGLLQDLAEALEGGLIASGGISSVEDLRRLAAIEGISGAIIGKALYDGLIPVPLPKF
ncbi:MAG: 1-(5-phosphoribosyl)-5-[(5-phosphoribosylamino)methylideneamino]imidazole-4-carboxamide isomerase [Terrimicrobiaceae bacterium]|nr:1-(5-phosphoribosyl)-5-[(5-phosphoribosylamino)methylideneamino]imidazole-4-carboxamide isomerase [Terrimicrobiaceae bacterium]